MRAFVPLSFALCSFACASSGTGDAGTSPDSGAQDSGTHADASAADAGHDDAMGAPDATEADAGLDDSGVVTDSGPRVGPVTVVFQPGAPFPGRGTAVFSDPSGNVLSVRTTSTGTIVANVPEGALLTATPEIFDGTNMNSRVGLVTVAGIAPGETYRVDPWFTVNIRGQMTFNGGTPYPGAASYAFDFGCSTYGIPDIAMDYSLTIPDNCTGTSSTTLTFLASALDINGVRLAYRVQENVPIVIGGRVALSGPWSTDFQHVDIHYSNPPAGAQSLLNVVVVTSKQALVDQENGQVAMLNVPAGTVPFQKARFGDGVSHEFRMQNGLRGESWMIRNTAAFVPSIDLDLTRDLLAFPSDVNVTSSTASPDRPVLDWTSDPSTDFVVVQVVIDGFNNEWLVFLPGGSDHFQLPALPDVMASLRPTAATSFQGAQRVIESSAISNYGQARAVFGQALLGWERGFWAQVIPSGITVRGAGILLQAD
ncbi:MAG: hypothetical protein U1E65_26285 [Myxococcota bacterium]